MTESIQPKGITASFVFATVRRRRCLFYKRSSCGVFIFNSAAHQYCSSRLLMLLFLWIFLFDWYLFSLSLHFLRFDAVKCASRDFFLSCAAA